MWREIAAAIGVVVTGVALIAGIIIVSPGWQRIIAAWRQGAAARSAMMRPRSRPRRVNCQVRLPLRRE